MRKLILQIGDRELVTKITFAVASELSRRVGDPLHISREMAKEQHFSELGIAYKSSFEWNVENIVETLFIAAKAADPTITRDEIADLVIAVGFIHAQLAALTLISNIIEPNSEELQKRVGEVQNEGSAGN
ncbi:hypothetical protein D6827_00090 [Candidatus Parcubacteria bacterium]|nr:MAG: hypothetical protein D6827_00090 [Candidatus Parcubacteria bacterium]